MSWFSLVAMLGLLIAVISLIVSTGSGVQGHVVGLLAPPHVDLPGTRD